MSNELHCRSKKLFRSSSDEEDVNSDEGEELEDIMRNFPRSTADIDLKPEIQKHSSESDQRNQSKRNEKSEFASRLNLLAKQDSNISDSSKTKARSLPEEARTILHEWYDKHSRNPTKDEKQELLRQTGIDPKQLKNWFCNTRQKEKKNQVAISAREKKNISLSENPLNAKQQKLGLERESERNRNDLERKPSDSIEESNERYSKYAGVYHSIISQKYKAQTTTPQNRCLGYFNLATDAARAVDIANIDMNTPGRVFNFESDDEYMMSRERELEEIGVNVKTSSKDGKLEGKRLEHCLVYRGVAYQRTTFKFKSFLFHNLTQKCLGTFALAADAAWRFDLEVLKLNASGWPRNFESRQSYVAARANELEGGSNDIHSHAEKDRETIVSWEKENHSFEDIQAKSNAKDSESAKSTSSPFPNSTGLEKDLDSNIDHKNSNMHNICNPKAATKVEQRVDSKSSNATGNDNSDRKKKVSKFRGVHFMNNRSKYSAKIGERYLGSFHLESDAARAYDISARQLKLPGCNFGSDEDYVRSREKELNSHCSKVDNADTGEETEGLGHLTYRGVSYNKTSGKYKSILFHNLKQNSLGSFTLAADAAMAFDMEVKRLDAPGWPLNFDNRQSYKLARYRELEKRGEKAERDSDKIKSQWGDYLKVRSKDPAFPPYVDQDEQCDDGMIRTNDHPNITSNEVRQKGTKDFSQVVEAQGSTSQSNQRDHNMVDASFSSDGDRQTGDEGKMESTSKLAGRQTCRTRENEAELEIGNAKRARLNEKAAQDDRSKHVDNQNNDDFETNTDLNAEGRITVPGLVDGEKLNDGVTVVAGETSQGVIENMNVGMTIKGAYCDSNDGLDYSEIRAFQDQYSSKKSRNLLMQLTTDQIEVLNCPFPVRTLVWVIAHCKNSYPVSFVVGRVVAVWMDLTEKVNPYEIQLNQSNTATSSIFIPENRIVFAPECPVSILAAKSWCPGRILCCDIKRNSQDPAAILQPSYIVQLHRNHGVFQRVQGIEPGRIKYRKINEDLSPSFHISYHANQCLSQFGTSGKKELKDDERGVDEIKSSQMSPQNYENFSPKSSMPSRVHRLQKSPNGEVSSNNGNDDVERALPRSGKMDRVDKQSKEGKTHEHSSIDAAMEPPKWDPPAPRCAQIPNEVQEFNAQKSSSNNKSTLNHTPRPPKWHPPASHDIPMPGKLSSGGASGEERKRARSPSSPRNTSAKDLSQKYTHERESSGRIPHCRVHFPKWLFYDNIAKDHLMYQFTKKNNTPENTNLLTVIGQKTNCSLRLENYESSRIFNRTHISIESNNMTNDPINVREAKEQIEDFLLKYIQHDGCQGRLLYDMARGDTVFHPRSNVRHFAGSVAIMQRNPFSRRREIGWMSVVELPFEVDRNSRRLYHGHSLIGLQSRLRNELSCFIKLCGNEFKRYPMKHGNPYAWVWGKQAKDVDSAIEVILAELKNHRRECRRCQFEGR